MSFIQLIFGITFQVGYLVRDGISMALPLTQVGMLALNPRQNPVHPPLHLYQIMDQLTVTILTTGAVLLYDIKSC